MPITGPLYPRYKPMRTLLREFDLERSLTELWGLSLHVVEKQPLPAGFMIGAPQGFQSFRRMIWPWDLDVIIREVILNAGKGSRSFRYWNDLCEVINHVRRLDDEAFGIERQGTAPDIMLEMHRIMNRQIPWQTGHGVNGITRAMRVFGADTLDSIVESRLGMTAEQAIYLGMAVGGHLLGHPGILSIKDYTALGMSREATASMFKRVAGSLEELRADIKRRQTYDADWLYIWNPVQGKPLVQFDPRHPERLLCPMPRWATERMSAGLFYDLVDADGFGAPFGKSFEIYIGEVLKTVGPQWLVSAEEPYQVQGSPRHGMDWIASDQTGHLFIETKTKRMAINARLLSDTTALRKDLKTLSEAVVQHYRNIADVKAGLTHWADDGKPSFPLIVTLEDWHIISPAVQRILGEYIREGLVAEGLSPDLLDAMPYLVASSLEIEIVGQVMAQVGIAAVMDRGPEYSNPAWSLLQSTRQRFPEAMKAVNRVLFGEDLDRINLRANETAEVEASKPPSETPSSNGQGVAGRVESEGLKKTI